MSLSGSRYSVGTVSEVLAQLFEGYAVFLGDLTGVALAVWFFLNHFVGAFSVFVFHYKAVSTADCFRHLSEVFGVFGEFVHVGVEESTRSEAAEIFDAVLENRALPAQKNIVLANAAFGIQVLEKGQKGIEECIAIARDSIDSGKALATFKKFVELNS